MNRLTREGAATQVYKSKNFLFAKQLIALAFGGLLALPTAALELKIVTEEFPPYNYMEDGQVKGLSAEVVREAARRISGLEYDMAIYPWLRTYKLATEQPNTAIFSIGRNAEREAQFHWVGVIAPARFYLFSLNAREDVNIESLEEAKSFRTGTFPKSVREQYLVSKGFEVDKHLTSIYDYERLFDLLVLKRIDLWAMNELLAYHIARKKGHQPEAILSKAVYLEDLSPEGYYLALNKESDPRIVEGLQRALEEMRRDGSYQKILQRYISQ